MYVCTVCLRDRTAQICALAQVMLDPFYRTIEGLATLIEKDWYTYIYAYIHAYIHA
jgi:myotubularin-related protein 6/7/8